MRDRNGSGPGALALQKLRALRDSKLKLAPSSLVMAIVLRENSASGFTYAGVETLAKDAKVVPRTAYRLLGELVDDGVIIRQRRRYRTSLLEVNLGKLLGLKRKDDEKKRAGFPQDKPVFDSQDSPFDPSEVSPGVNPDLTDDQGNSPLLSNREPLTPLPPAAGTAEEKRSSAEAKAFLLVRKALELMQDRDYSYPGGQADLKESLKVWAAAEGVAYGPTSIDQALYRAVTEFCGESGR